MSLWFGNPPPPRFPFWSAIIAQAQSDVSVPTGTNYYVDIQPPAGETWLAWIDHVLPVPKGYDNELKYYDYDGTTRRVHKGWARLATTNYDYGHLFRMHSVGVCKVLTNSLYASLYFFQNSGISRTGYYGYSGFKLSKPLWSPRRSHNPEPPKPWKRELTVSLPAEVEVLRPYACEVFDPDLDDYFPAIMLEEDTPLAVDPATNFPVERLTVVVMVKNLVNLLSQRGDPMLRPDVVLEAPPKYRGRRFRELTDSEFEEVAGYKKYFQRWRDEGIEI